MIKAVLCFSTLCTLDSSDASLEKEGDLSGHSIDVQKKIRGTVELNETLK